MAETNSYNQIKVQFQKINNMNNVVIKVLNKEHGREVIQFFKNRGINTGGHSGFMGEKEFGPSADIYYGMIQGQFRNYNIHQVHNTHAVIVELPKSDSIYPKLMWVWNTDKSKAAKRVVIAHKKEKYISWVNADSLEQAEDITSTTEWNHASDEDPNEKVSITAKEIAHKFGIPIEKLVIIVE